MIFTISIILFLLTLYVGNIFWAPKLHKKALSMLLEKSDIFKKILSKDFFLNDNVELSRWTKPLPNGYSINLFLFLAADDNSKRNTQIIFAIILFAIVIASYFVNWIILVINILIIILLAFQNPSKTALVSELETLRIIALIIYHWHNTEKDKCDIWISENVKYKLLYEHIIATDCYSDSVP